VAGGRVSAPSLPPRTRGVIALVEGNCTVCNLCVKECPVWCIHIEAHKEVTAPASGGRDRTRVVLDRFAIDYSLCMYCSICVDVCPFDALFWSPEYAYPEGDLRDLVHERDRLGAWVSGVPAPEPPEEGAEPAKELGAAGRGARRPRR
jgi:NADH-quinone oxidoreductase subunit I